MLFPPTLTCSQVDLEAGAVLALYHWRITDSLTVCLLVKCHPHRPNQICRKCNAEAFCEPQILQRAFNTAKVQEMQETALILAQYNIFRMLNDGSLFNAGSCHCQLSPFHLYTTPLSYSLCPRGCGRCWTQRSPQEEAECSVESRSA